MNSDDKHQILIPHFAEGDATSAAAAASPHGRHVRKDPAALAADQPDAEADEHDEDNDFDQDHEGEEEEEEEEEEQAVKQPPKRDEEEDGSGGSAANDNVEDAGDDSDPEASRVVETTRKRPASQALKSAKRAKTGERAKIVLGCNCRVSLCLSVSLCVSL